MAQWRKIRNAPGPTPRLPSPRWHDLETNLNAEAHPWRPQFVNPRRRTLARLAGGSTASTGRASRATSTRWATPPRGLYSRRRSAPPSPPCTAIRRAFAAASTCAGTRFGEGEYQYFAYPLPAIVAELREATYPRLAPIANRWQRSARPRRAAPAGSRRLSRALPPAGQRRPTPLLLKVRPGRLQSPASGSLRRAALPAADGDPAERARPRLRGRRVRADRAAAAHPVAGRGGAACPGRSLIFAVNFRPTRGARGYYRVAMRHGVSRVRSGARYTLGIIFHDAA